MRFLANVAIAIRKYVAAALTGSSAMLAEALHATAVTGNELLLLVGMKRSSRPPDEFDPYGHGKALYFYSLLLAKTETKGYARAFRRAADSLPRYRAQRPRVRRCEDAPQSLDFSNGLLGLH